MKPITTAAVLFSALFLLSSCGSVSDESAPETTNSDRAANNGSVSGTAAQTAPLGVPTVPEANTTEPGANTAVANPGQDIRGRKMDRLRGPMGAQSGTTSPPKPTTYPAPDNSVYTVVLTDAAVETRTFKSHPQLVRVEKRSDGKQSSIKVFLKDGRLIDLPGERIEALSTAPASAILAAAGLRSSPSGEQKPVKKKITSANPQ